MKVTLLNDNPAVSRLVGISLSKLGYDFTEVSSLEDAELDNDLFICDSGLFDANADYHTYAKNVVYLVPREHGNLDEHFVLEKPFLPTDFINMVEKATLSTTKPDIDGFKTIDDLEPIDGDKDDNLDNNVKLGNEFGEFQDLGDDVFGDIDNKNFSDLSLDDLEEFQDDDVDKELNELGLDELNDENLELDHFDDDQEASKSLDKIDELAQDDETIQEKEIENIEDQNEDEELKEEPSDDEEVTQDLDDMELEDEPILEKKDDSKDDELGELSNMLEEIDNMDVSAQAVEDDLELDEAQEEDMKLEDLPSLEEINEELDEAEDFDFETIDEDKKEDEGMQDSDSMPDFESFKEIEELDENDVKVALNEEITPNLAKKSDDINGIKTSIAKKISDEISLSLNSSSLKEVLKDLNIKINISFEEKA